MQINIVSKSLSETMMCPELFIVKILIIRNMNSRHINMKQKEGASVQDSGETERESVCESGQIAKNRSSISCKNSRWRNGPFGIS